MGKVHEPPPAVLFAGILAAGRADRGTLVGTLVEEFGAVVLDSAEFPFTETDYYACEMGSPLVRRFLAFDRLIGMERIAEIKLRTNRLEEEAFSEGGKRIVNIDPGYLTSAKVVLATTKDFRHRVYLREGIYAEVTLRYSAGRGTYQPWEWTYGDYRRSESLGFFNELRTLYRGMLRGR